MTDREKKAVQQRKMKTQSTSFETGGWKALMMMGSAAQQLQFGEVFTEIREMLVS